MVVKASSAVNVTSWADVYVPPSGLAVVVGAVGSMLMVYSSVFSASSFPAGSIAENLSVVVVDIGMGVE